METHWVWVIVGFVSGLVCLIVWARNRGRALGEGSDSCVSSGEVSTYVRENIAAIAAEEFPDAGNVTWTVLETCRDGEWTFAEIEPEPATVGYPRFQLVFVAVDDGPPQVIATYCLEGYQYNLLATAPGAPKNLPRSFSATAQEIA